MMLQKSLYEFEKHIDMEKFSKVFTPEIKKVISVVRKYGFDIRVVGGAVRDFLQGIEPRDVDFATDAEPAELIFIFDLENIHYEADGIVHGTIKAVFGKEKIEVTSIGYRLKKVNNTIDIERHNSWAFDSMSRDITVNSMSIDMNGVLYDYQNAIHDLKKQLVRFCPNIQNKIDQDPTNLLRWIKAIAHFEKPKWLKKDKEVVKANVGKLKDIKDVKRTKLLLAGLLSSPNKTKVFKLMCDIGIAQELDLTCKN